MGDGDGGTVEVPKVGRVSKMAVVATVAVAGGVIGYAWWRRRQTTASAIDPNAIDPATGQSYAAESAGGVSTYSPAPTGNGNVSVSDGTSSSVGDWTARAVERLQSVGVDPGAATEAIARWLGHQGLTAAQKVLVMEARSLANDPPISPIPPMLDALPVPQTGGGTAPGAVTSLRATSWGSTWASFAWAPTPGATAYVVSQPAGNSREVTGTEATVGASLGGNVTYPYTQSVSAKNASGTGPAAHVTITSAGSTH